MNCQVMYKKKEDILYREFKHCVTMKDIVDSWKYIFKKYVHTNKFSKIITDYTKCTILITTDEIDEFQPFYKKNKDTFNRIKFVQIIDSPDVAIALLFSSKNPEFCTKVFATLGEAEKWMDNPCEKNYFF